MAPGHHIDVAQTVATKAQAQGAVLVDVREFDEWNSGHAPGAVHLPFGAVGDELDRLAGQSVFTVCRGGGRSAKAAEILAAVGVEVRNVAGGMSAWGDAGLPVVGADGSPGAVG